MIFDNAPTTILTVCAAALITSMGCGEADTPAPAPPAPTGTETTQNSRTPAAGIATCGADTNPDGITPPTAETQLEDWRFELSGSTVRSVEGTVLSTRGVTNPRVIEQAVLVGSGGFLESGCSVTHSGTSYSWSGIACQDTPGTLLNVFLVLDEGVDLPTIRQDARLRLSGFEIDRFKDYSAGGGYWQDGGDRGTEGQVSLWVTQICALD